MVAIQAPIEKTRTYTPVRERAVFSAPRGLARARGKYARVRFNDLSQLWPENQLRQYALKFAQQFVRDMEKQGFLLASAEADVLVSGPYEPRQWSKLANGMMRGKRHVRTGPASARRDVEISLLPTLGRTFGAESQSDTEEWILEADFISTRTVRVEHKVVSPDADG